MYNIQYHGNRCKYLLLIQEEKVFLALPFCVKSNSLKGKGHARNLFVLRAKFIYRDTNLDINNSNLVALAMASVVGKYFKEALLFI